MKTNTKLLNAWLKANGKRSREELAFKSGIGFHSIVRVILGKKDPTGAEQIAICHVTGIPKELLFPKD